MATLAALKKQLATLEAQVQRATKAEMGNAISKVRKIMSEFGLTIEHLADSSSGKRAAVTKGAAKKQSKKTAGAKKGSKPPKYQDPATGVTWAGVGRAPSWIANAKNRDEFLIAQPATATESVEASAPAKKAKRAAPVKRAKASPVAKKVARRSVAAKKAPASAEESKAPVKRASAKKGAAKNAAGKKVAGKKAASKKAASKVATKQAPSKRKSAAAAPAEPSAGAASA